MNKNDQQRSLNEIDYIDIPAFVRSMKRYARKYILFVLPLIICMTVCLAIFSKPYAKKYYVAGGTFMAGVRLSGSLSYDYTLSDLSWNRQSTLAHVNDVLNALTESGYLYQVVKESMGLKRNDGLNGQIYINAPYSTNLIDISVMSDSPEDAEEIRDAVFACFPDAVFPAVGFIEMDIQEMYSREESSPRAFLTSHKVWAAGGVVLGILGYLGLIFLFTLSRRDVETPEDVSKLTDLYCIGRLPMLKKRMSFRKRGNTGELKDYLHVTKEYEEAFRKFRRSLSEEIRERKSKILLLTGTGHRRGQTVIAAELEKDWLKMGKKVVRADLALIDGPMTEEKVRFLLNQYKEADLILIDGPSCGQSADALILADCADAMIMVIREGQSQPDEIKDMFQSLQYAHARSLGYVLNLCSNM